MRHLAEFLVLAVLVTCASVGGAFADHMNGQYRGTGQVDGTLLAIQQSGTEIRGQLSGTNTGTLEARSDGGDAIQGSVDIVGDGRYQLVGRWSREGLSITLKGAGGEGTVLFVPAAAGGGQQQPRVGGPTLETQGGQVPLGQGNGQVPLGTGGAGNGGTPPLQGQQAPAMFYVFADGKQTGPMPLPQAQALIAAGTVTRDTLVWQPGQPEWQAAGGHPALAGLFPPEPPKAESYFVAANGQQVGPLSREEIVARIAAGETGPGDFMWKKGMEAWAAAGGFTEFAEAFAARETPPALPGQTGGDTPPELPGSGGETPPLLPDTAGGQAGSGGTGEAHTHAEGPAAGSGAMPFIEQQVDETLPGADAATRQKAIDCVAEAFSSMSTEDAARMGDIATPLTDEERQRFSATYPDLEEAAMRCLFSDVDLGPEEASSSVSLDDGRSLIVVGGSNQSLLPAPGGYRITLDGTEIVYANGAISVAGVPRETPRFKRNLEIRLKDGEIVLTPDVR